MGSTDAPFEMKHCPTIPAPVVTSCGSGITASVLALALAVIGNRRTSVYDGAWAEWGADKTLPIETTRHAFAPY